MRELTLTGDVCNVLKKIHELAELIPTGADILYPIENWDPRSIKATDEKRNLETLDAMYHVIKLKGYVPKDKALIFSLTQTKLFEDYYYLNCNSNQTQKPLIKNPSPKVKIHINELKGLYRDDDHQLRYEVRGNRKKFVLNLHHGYPINHELPTILDSNISIGVAEVNRISRLNLHLDFDLIDHSKSSSYFIHQNCLLIEDDISPIVISDR